MGSFVDLTGKKFWRLTVVCRVHEYRAPNGWHTPQWLCQCDCGNKVDEKIWPRSGDTESKGEDKLCFGMSCPYEGTFSGECRKAYDVPCPMDEDCPWDEEDFLYEKYRREGYED